ncbi:hypothetical protein CVT26_015307 [Gymnopilus dilepis]|uniref:F-box domain-containing protein n=1 Tax=Gymnopilus dilepis TaxID=231916 RepID=A0A409YE85_9AGAR|nr:hypothetical protein CVT26_015307 [Gymnopilus dilepis]
MSPPDSPSAQQEVDRLALSLEATSLLKQPGSSPPEQTFDDLPDDVASIIFQFHSIDLAGKPRLLNLGAVCRRWRDITWATPSLWTSLNASFWGYKEQPSDIQLELIRAWLNRSGNLPLSISLTVYGGNKEGVFGRLREMVEILNYHCDHWYSLDLDVPSDLITYVGTSKCTLSKLNELSLKSEGGVGRLPIMSQFSPCVVKIESVQWRVQDLDWTRVTNLVIKLGFIAVHQALGILRAAPSLLNCSLASIGHHEDGVSSAEAYRHVTHPTLRALAVNISGRYSYQADQLFFTNISLPALEKFSVFGSGDKIDAGSLVIFLRQSACQLKSLSLDGSDIPGTGLIQLVRTVPSLEALYITSHYPEYGNLDHFYYAFSQHLL